MEGHTVVCIACMLRKTAQCARWPSLSAFCSTCDVEHAEAWAEQDLRKHYLTLISVATETCTAL